MVLVLGSHRSGTSLLARIVGLCGVPADPDDTLMKPGPDNEKGYWEPTYLAEINDKILQAWGGYWCDPPLSPPTRPGLDSTLERLMRESVEPWIETRQSWVWKDPRMTVTLPAWGGILPRQVALISVRNPLDVWHSLFRRDRFSRGAAYLLWEVYTRAALRHTEGRPRIVVHYEHLIDAPEATVDDVAAFLSSAGVAFSKSPSLDPAYQECLGPLQHHRHPAEEFFKDDAATSSQKQLYRQLLKADPCDPPSLRGEMSTPAPAARERLGNLLPLVKLAEKAQLEEERFNVLDGKLGSEINLAHERFLVLDEKLGRHIQSTDEHLRALRGNLDTHLGQAQLRSSEMARATLSDDSVA